MSCRHPARRGYDGRSRVIQLLQEIPDPLSTVSYGAWAGVSAADAQRILAGLLALAHSDCEEVIKSIECTLEGNDVAVALSSGCCAPELARYASRVTELGVPIEMIWW
jgi:hypothetical protein